MLDLASLTTGAGTATAATLSVSYDAASASYTLTTPGRTATFGSGDITTNNASQIVFQKTDAGGRDSFTLVKNLLPGPALQYVRLGFWQHDVQTASQQITQFDAFNFGFDTPAAAAPRTGSANYGISVFGLVTNPGAEPHNFSGTGRFSADFFSGVYSLTAPLTEIGLVSGLRRSGADIKLDAAGHLSASDGTFTGNAAYYGSVGYIGGRLSGRLYGPGAEELGASFSGSAYGSAFSGALEGQRSNGFAPVNQTLTNLIAPQLFVAPYVDLVESPIADLPLVSVITGSYQAQFNLKLDGSFTFDPGITGHPNLNYSSAVQVASADPNFTAYQQTSNGRPVRLSLYKLGGSNSELALTYSSFGTWSGTLPSGGGIQSDRIFFAYGQETPLRLLSGRTGSAHYTGVVYGAAETQSTRATYDVRGSSIFDVDFTRQNYSGSLALRGIPTNGAAAIDFGSFDFNWTLFDQTRNSSFIFRNASPVGGISTSFYGPDGEEIAGHFNITVQDPTSGAVTRIGGATVAKR